MKRVYIGAVVLLVIIVAAAWWMVARRGCKTSTDCKAGAACSEGKCVSAPAGAALPPAGIVLPPAGVVPPPPSACTSERLRKIQRMSGTTSMPGVGQAVVQPGECISDGEWLTFQLADVAGNLGTPLGGKVEAQSSSECSTVCGRDPSCATWVMGPNGCRLWSNPPEIIVGAMSSTVGVRAGSI